MIRYLNKKEENRYHDRDDPDYYGIRDIERLLGDVDVGDSYKPILVKTAFKEDEEDESGYRIGYKLYESRGDKDKISSAEQYLVKIKPYLRDLINEHKTPESGEWKSQLNMHTSFISSKGTGETRNTNILSDNEKIMWAYETKDIINNFFISLKNNYQSEEQIMRNGSDFKFESIDRFDHKLHKIKLRRGGSYIESPRWIRNKRATINPKNVDDDDDDDDCFEHSLIAALNYQNIKNHPERISNLKPFINDYNWERGYIFHHTKTVKKKVRNQKILCELTIKSLNKIMIRLHSIYYMYVTIKKRYVLHMNQNIIASAKIK